MKVYDEKHVSYDDGTDRHVYDDRIFHDLRSGAENRRRHADVPDC